MTSAHRGASTLPIWLALAISGCGNDGPTRAGDRPLQNGDATPDGVPSWALAAEPRFSITESEGDPPFAFSLPSEAVILDDGSTLIRDRSTHLIYVDSVGSGLRIAGSPGEGPGEFQYLNAILAAPGGSGIWAWEQGSGRLSHFDRSGEYLTFVVLPGRTGAPPVAILPGPTFVTIAEPGEGADAAPAPRLYALRDSQWAVVREIRGPPEPISPSLTYEVSGRLNHTSLPAGCLPRIEEFVIGDELFAADAASGVIHAFGEDGSMREVYRASRRQGVTREVVTALERRFSRASWQAPAHVLRDVLDRVGDRLPAWQRVLADPEGRIWLERSVCPLGGGDDVFDVVGVDGRELGSITIPKGMLVLAVRGDNVLVRRTGELDIQYVEMYPLAPRSRS